MDLTFIENNLYLVVALVLWEIFWKGLALWRAAKNDDRYWFIALLFINTVGVLPIVYLLMHLNNIRKMRFNVT